MCTQIIVDTGANTIKVGTADQDEVQVQIPTLLGEPLSINQNVENDFDELYFGLDALELASKLSLIRPIQNGVVQDWDDMLKLWIVSLSKLQCESTNSNVVLTQQPINDPDFRVQSAELFFETFKVNSLNYVNQALVGMYQSGITTGVIYYSGESQSVIMPIFEGYQLFKQQINEITGNQLTCYFKQLLHDDSSQCFNTSAHMEWVRTLKEQHCFVCDNFNNYLKNNYQMEVQLPDNQRIQIKSSIFAAPEAFYKPSLINKDQQGIQYQICDAIKSCDQNIQDQLYGNIILVGGNTLFIGFDQRLQGELCEAAPGKNIHIHGGVNRANQIYEGAVIMCSLSSFKDQCVDKHQYYEEGASKIARKYNS